jgi:hypothetical protein
MLLMLMPAAAASSCAAVLLLLKLAAMPLNLCTQTATSSGTEWV